MQQELASGEPMVGHGRVRQPADLVQVGLVGTHQRFGPSRGVACRQQSLGIEVALQGTHRAEQIGGIPRVGGRTGAQLLARDVAERAAAPFVQCPLDPPRRANLLADTVTRVALLEKPPGEVAQSWAKNRKRRVPAVDAWKELFEHRDLLSI